MAKQAQDDQEEVHAEKDTTAHLKVRFCEQMKDTNEFFTKC